MDQPHLQSLQTLRRRRGLSIRSLGERAGVTAAMISCIERGKNSPSLATLQKILAALGMDLASFFGGRPAPQDGPVFLGSQMHAASDAERNYTIIFPKRKDIAVEMLDEHLYPGRRAPPFETLPCDVAGYVILGTLVLELKGQGKQTLHPGDAFYIVKGTPHRGRAAGPGPARLITVCSPPRY